MILISLLSILLPNSIAAQGTMTIGVEACIDWFSSSYSSALQLQLRGVSGQTEFFVVNEGSALPINGERTEFELSSDLVADIGEIYGVQIVVQDEDGYCISGLDISSPQYKWIVDGNDENDVDLEPECKALSATNSNYNAGMLNGTGIGYSCCLDNGYSNRYGCSTGGAYTYQQAEDKCAEIGLRVCTRTEIERNRGSGTGCEFDGTLVWTSTSCTQTTTFDSAQFGSGIILRPQCHNSFMGISRQLPMLPCFESKIDLLSESPRGIYNLTLHACNMDSAGLGVNNMKDSLYTSIQGNSPSGDSYIASGIQYLDHFSSIGLNWDSLGAIAATNWKMGSTYGYFYPNYDTARSLIGLKFEAVDWKNYPLQQGQFSSLDLYGANHGKTYDANPNLVRVVEDGRYVIVGFAALIQVMPEYEVRLRYLSYAKEMNVYVIAANDWEDYDLPFIAYTSDGHLNFPPAKSFPAAEKYCRDTYGTSLLSIHSADQMFLLKIFESVWGRWSWIGLNDRKLDGTFQWSDGSAVDFTNWYPGEPGTADSNDCVPLYWGWYQSQWHDTSCANNYNPLCTNPVWSKDETRTFQVNADTYMEDIVSVTIGNNNENSICFDEVMINGESASYISSHWVGSTPDTDNIIAAIFKYPVCDSEVIDIRVDSDDVTVVDITKSEMVQMSCVNRNRLISTQCGVSQEYDTTTTTSFSFGSGTGSSTSSSRSNEYNWGSSSSISYGTSSSHQTTTTSSFSCGSQSYRSFRFFGLSSSSSSWSRLSSSATSRSSYSSSRFSQNNNWNGGSRITKYENENSRSTSQDVTYGTSEVFSVACDATADIPPGHSMDYTLIFTQKNTTLKTYTDFKLTLCSAFLNPAHPDDPQNFVYLNDVEGVLNKQETTTCNVDFAPAKALLNDISCIEEQQMAISSGADYIPTCREEDPSKYTPCQCQSGYSMKPKVCYCVDQLGNIVDNRMKELISENTTGDVCAALKCDESGFSASSIFQLKDKTGIDAIDGNKGLNGLRIALIGSMIVIVICTVAIVICAASKCRKSPKVQFGDDEEEENMKETENLVDNIAI